MPELQETFEFDPAVDTPGDKLEEAAMAAYREQPGLLGAVIRVSLEMKRAGLRRWSINAAFEVVRYQYVLAGGRVYKVNNNHRSFFARWIMRDIPELAAFFGTREQARVAQEYDE
jgi:hypothetical protein